jgi:hypothetical protein
MPPHARRPPGQLYIAKTQKEAEGYMDHILNTKLRQLGVTVAFSRIKDGPDAKGAKEVKEATDNT